MQDIGPDMEDLLRRASEHYPLKQSEDRWNEIASKINSTPEAQPAKKHLSGYKKYYVMLLLLLLFLFFYYFLLHPSPEQKPYVQKLPNLELQGGSEKIFKEEVLTGRKTARSKSQTENKDNSKNRSNPEQFINKVAGKEKWGTKTKPIYNNTDLRQKEVFVNGLHPLRNKNRLYALNEPIVVYRALSLDSLRLISIQQSFTTLDSYRSSKNGFYYGLFLGPGYNTVKKQAMNKPGFSIGLIGGYRFSNRISVETGLSLSEKKYATAGTHFSMEEIGPAMPPPMKLMDVRGSYKVIQIPVHFRYNVIYNKSYNVFSSAGLSSFILTKESNEYHISMNGAEEMMYGTYKINKSYLAASIDLSFGYERNFGNKNTIRIQPYIQLPAKGIGVGNIEVKSTGLHIAITRLIR